MHTAAMDATTTKETAVEVCKILDSLTALTVDLSCHRHTPAERLVLSAHEVRESCKVITEAVHALKRILELTEAHGGGLIPSKVLANLQASRPD